MFFKGTTVGFLVAARSSIFAFFRAEQLGKLAASRDPQRRLKIDIFVLRPDQKVVKVASRMHLAKVINFEGVCLHFGVLCSLGLGIIKTTVCNLKVLAC